MPRNRTEFKKKQIRNFFLSLEKNKKQNSDTKDYQEDLAEKGLAYRQMYLPVKEITPDFEAKIKEKVDHNIMHAKIREASKEDLETVMYLYNRAWLTSNTPYAPLDIDSLKKIHSYPETVILIAKVYGTDAGFVILDFEGKNNEIGIIAGLGVIPRYQRKGLGIVIGMAAWQYFKERGVKELRCEVYVDNEVSHHFINALGFREGKIKIYKEEDFDLTSS